MNDKKMNIVNTILYYVLAPALILEFYLADFGVLTFTRELYGGSVAILFIFILISFFYKKKYPGYDFKPNEMYTRVLFVAVLIECFSYMGFFK